MQMGRTEAGRVTAVFCQGGWQRELMPNTVRGQCMVS
jgi:hypothetical protein